MKRPQVRRELINGVNNGRYKGARMRKWGKWVAEVRQPNSRERIWLGSYDTAEEAARAYDAAVFCLRGPDSTLNFPKDPPDIPLGLASELSRSQIQVAASRHARKGWTESDSVVGTVGTELNSPLVEYKFFGGCLELGGGGGDGFGEVSTEDCYVESDEGGGGNNMASGGAFYQTQHPRMLTF